MSAGWDRVRAWWHRRPAPTGARQVASRWIVVDVETSGLDAQRDRLLAIAALGLNIDAARRRIEIVPGDSFEVVLKQEAVSTRANILLHGIGEQRQREGMDPAQAMQAFSDFAGDCPLLAFHSAFDQTLIGRHMRQLLGRSPPNRWLDVADLCAVTHDTVRARTLDDWLAHFGIPCLARHQASADALATAELMLRIWPRVAQQGTQWRDLERLASHRRWISGH